MRCLAHEVEYCQPCQKPRAAGEIYAEISDTHTTVSPTRELALWRELASVACGTGLPEWVHYGMGALIGHLEMRNLGLKRDAERRSS